MRADHRKTPALSSAHLCSIAHACCCAVTESCHCVFDSRCCEGKHVHTSTMHNYISSKHGSGASVLNFRMFGFPDQGSDDADFRQDFDGQWTFPTP